MILMVLGGAVFYQHAAPTVPEGIILGVVGWGCQGYQGYQGRPLYLYELLSVQPRHLLGLSKVRTIVKARALCCCRAVRELDISMSNMADRLKIAGPTVSVALKKGDKIVSNEGLVLADVLNISR